MKKINVVKSNQEFNDIIKTGNCIKNSFFVIYTKKICNAVNRNKLKRKVRNILDNYKNLYSKSEDYIIILRNSCLDADYKVLEDNLIYLLKKIKEKD